MRSKGNIDNFITELAVIVTVLSFSPNMTVESICSLLMYGLWGLLLVIKICQRKFYVDSFVKGALFFFVFWYAFTRILYAIDVYPSAGLGVVTYLPYCTVFYAIGMNYQVDREGSIKRLVRAFVIGQIFLMITLLPYLDELQTQYYQFVAKNQMGQMLGLGIIFELLILTQIYQSLVKKVILWIASGFSLLALMIIHSRTPLIAIMVVVIFNFVLKKEKRKTDFLTIGGGLIVIGFVIIQLGGISYLQELFGMTENGSFNDITNGRGSLFIIAIQDFLKSPIVGLGGYAYVDNFVLNVLRCGGLLLGIVILPLTYSKLFDSIKIARQNIAIYDRKSDYGLIFNSLQSMTIFYFVVSLMEGYPPLGPNTSVFFLWLIMGIGNQIVRSKANEIKA